MVDGPEVVTTGDEGVFLKRRGLKKSPETVHVDGKGFRPAKCGYRNE